MEFKASDEVLSDAQTGEPLGEVAPPKEDTAPQAKQEKAVTMDTRDTGSEELIAAKSAEALGNAVAEAAKSAAQDSADSSKKVNDRSLTIGLRL